MHAMEFSDFLIKIIVSFVIVSLINFANFVKNKQKSCLKFGITQNLKQLA